MSDGQKLLNSNSLPATANEDSTFMAGEYSQLSNTTVSATTMTMLHRQSGRNDRSYSRPGRTLDTLRPASLGASVSVENRSPQKQPGAGARDRFLPRVHHAGGSSGALAEACGVKVNRILEFGEPAPQQRQFGPVDFVNQYANAGPARNAVPHSIQRPRRKVSTTPTRILDAPGILDDFYLNVLDWSKPANSMAIGLEQTVYAWNGSNGEVSVVAELGGDAQRYVAGVKWAQDEAILGVATSTGEVQLWDASSGTKIRTMRGRTGRVASLAWNGPILSSGGRDGRVWQHDVRVKQHKVAELVAHSGEVCGMAWRGDGNILASGGNDNTIALWDARGTSVPRHRLSQHTAAVKALAWCPWQSSLLATGGGSSDRQINFWHATTGARVNTIDAEAQVTALHWSNDHHEIVASLGYPFNGLSVWSYPHLTPQAKIIGAHDSRILGAALCSDEQTLITCAADENIKFWKLFEAPHKSRARESIGLLTMSRRI